MSSYSTIDFLNFTVRQHVKYVDLYVNTKNYQTFTYDDTLIVREELLNKQYFASLEHFQGNILFIGIKYDEKSKSHICKIEKI